ncbi:MAG: hypothetical protein K8U03_05990 [Planctomycetia bacterium]|nr:hypothetical protein [Planctomycetia bacterium]
MSTTTTKPKKISTKRPKPLPPRTVTAKVTIFALLVEHIDGQTFVDNVAIPGVTEMELAELYQTAETFNHPSVCKECKRAVVVQLDLQIPFAKQLLRQIPLVDLGRQRVVGATSPDWDHLEDAEVARYRKSLDSCG